MRQTFLVGVIAIAVAAAAQAQTCEPVTALPASIVEPGVYCLTGDLSTSQTSGAAVVILSNDVVFDLGGFTLDGSAAGSATLAYGVNASQRRNVTIKGPGTIRGFLIAAYLSDGAPWTASQGNVVDGVRFDRNTYAGVVVMGTGNIVQRNTIVATGGTTATGYDSAVAIQTNGVGNRVLDNDVSGVTARAAGIAYAISLTGSDHFAVGNRMTKTQRGLYFSAVSAGKYRDNLTSSVTVPYTSGTDVGNNF